MIVLFASFRSVVMPGLGPGISPGTCVHFEAGWSGICTVHETIRNGYMLR